MLGQETANKAFAFDERKQIFILDPWEGLTDEKGRKVNLGDQQQMMPMLGGMDIGMALQNIDTQLKRDRVSTVFIMKNMTERHPMLIQAVRSWATDSCLYKNGSVIFIFADSADKVLDDFTKSLVAIIKVPISSADERREIAEKVASEIEKTMNVPKRNLKITGQLIDAMAGLNLHDCESVLLESFFKHKKFDIGYISEFKASMVKKSGVLEIMTPRLGFEAVGDYESTKDFITKEIINVLKEPERAEKMGIRPPRGILLFGPPGTGKTLLGRTFAFELKLPFIELRLENIMRSLVGETEQRIRSAIDLIEEVSPSVVFIDEMDRLGVRTDVSLDSGVSRRLFSSLLEWLGDDKRKAIVVGTTNEPDHLDPAMLRAGRLDRKIPLMLPGVEARKQIFIVHTSVQRTVPLSPDVSFDKLAQQTAYFSGAEIEELVLRAARKAFNEKVDKVSMKHFDDTLETFNIDLTSRKQMVERYLSLAEKYSDDTGFIKSIREQSHEIGESTRVQAMAKAMETGEEKQAKAPDKYVA